MVILLEDLATAASGLFNAGYFARYWVRAYETRARRTGAAALFLVGTAVAVEAACSEAIIWWRDSLLALGDVAWALARLPLLVSTAFITVIVLRRIFR
jgi:hypothetical protein